MRCSEVIHNPGPLTLESWKKAFVPGSMNNFGRTIRTIGEAEDPSQESSNDKQVDNLFYTLDESPFDHENSMSIALYSDSPPGLQRFE
jgi:hypothetical protein